MYIYSNMISSLAIQMYFNNIGHLLERQGFPKDTQIVCHSDDEGDQKLLDQALANTDMTRKGTTTKATVRKDPFTFIFWSRSQLENIVRQSYRALEVHDDGRHGKKTVSGSFELAAVLVSNKANLVEDFSEAFAAEYQNIHNFPLSLKHIYDDPDADKVINFTCIQNLGEGNYHTFRVGDLFTYSWSVRIYMNYVSEFAHRLLQPLEKVVVDMYNPNGVPLSSIVVPKP